MRTAAAKKAKVKSPLRPLYDIANEIRKDWKPVNGYAKPYVEAMGSLQSVEDNYFCDSGYEIVGKFLNSASTWRGETARRVKKELNGMLK